MDMKTLGFLFVCVGFALVQGQYIGRELPLGASCTTITEFKCDIWRRDRDANPVPGCIPESWRCNGIIDCESTEDESPQTCEYTIPELCTGDRTYFNCGNNGGVSGVCVANGGVCDGVPHCGGTDKDEKCWKGPRSAQCQNVNTNDYMTCPSNGRCVPESVKCDGYRHCAKTGIVSDDEEGCTQSGDDVCGTATPVNASQAGSWGLAVDTDPGYYSNYLDCSTEIENLDPPQTIRITVNQMDIERNTNPTACHATDMLSIKDTTMTTPVTLCGYSSEPFDLDFGGQTVDVSFTSDGLREFSGFQLSFDIVCKNETFTEQTGSTGTPFYGSRLPLNMDCTKVVNVNTAVAIKVNGSDFGEGDGMEITDAKGNTYSTNEIKGSDETEGSKGSAEKKGSKESAEKEGSKGSAEKSFGDCGIVLQGPITIHLWSDDVDTFNTGASVSWTAVGDSKSGKSGKNGACQHGAKCKYGACVCKKPWGGEYCEIKTKRVRKG